MTKPSKDETSQLKQQIKELEDRLMGLMAQVEKETKLKNEERELREELQRSIDIVFAATNGLQTRLVASVHHHYE